MLKLQLPAGTQQQRLHGTQRAGRGGPDARLPCRIAQLQAETGRTVTLSSFFEQAPTPLRKGQGLNKPLVLPCRGQQLQVLVLSICEYTEACSIKPPVAEAAVLQLTRSFRDLRSISFRFYHNQSSYKDKSCTVCWESQQPSMQARQRCQGCHWIRSIEWLHSPVFEQADWWLPLLAPSRRLRLSSPVAPLAPEHSVRMLELFCILLLRHERSLNKTAEPVTG